MCSSNLNYFPVEMLFEKKRTTLGGDSCRYSVYTLEWCTLSGYMVYIFEKCVEKKHLSLLLNINIYQIIKCSKILLTQF